MYLGRTSPLPGVGCGDAGVTSVSFRVTCENGKDDGQNRGRTRAASGIGAVPRELRPGGATES